MFSVKEILQSPKFREQEPLNRKVVIGQVSIATDSCRAVRSAKQKQLQLEQSPIKNKKKSVA